MWIQPRHASWSTLDNCFKIYSLLQSSWGRDPSTVRFRLSSSSAYQLLWSVFSTVDPNIHRVDTHREGGRVNDASLHRFWCLLTSANDTDCWIHYLCHYCDFYHIKEKHFCWAWQSWFWNPITWGVGGGAEVRASRVQSHSHCGLGDSLVCRRLCWKTGSCVWESRFLVS